MYIHTYINMAYIQYTYVCMYACVRSWAWLSDPMGILSTDEFGSISTLFSYEWM